MKAIDGIRRRIHPLRSEFMSWTDERLEIARHFFCIFVVACQEHPVEGNNDSVHAVWEVGTCNLVL